MFGAISVKMILSGFIPLRRPRSTKSLERNEKVWGADGSSCPGPREERNVDTLEHQSSHLKIGRYDQKNNQRWNDQNNVGQHVEYFIRNTAAIPGRETDEDANQGPQPAAYHAYEER